LTDAFTCHRILALTDTLDDLISTGIGESLSDPLDLFFRKLSGFRRAHLIRSAFETGSTFSRDSCQLAHPSGSEHGFTRQPTGVVGRKEHRYRPDIIWLAAAAWWGLCDQVPDHIAPDKAASMRALSFYESGVG
jgi:hypothetical protein